MVECDVLLLFVAKTNSIAQTQARATNDFSLQHSIMRKLGDAHHHHVKPVLVGVSASLPSSDL